MDPVFVVFMNKFAASAVAGVPFATFAQAWRWMHARSVGVSTTERPLFVMLHSTAEEARKAQGMVNDDQQQYMWKVAEQMTDDTRTGQAHIMMFGAQVRGG